jgi:hypothetical protein
MGLTDEKRDAYRLEHIIQLSDGLPFLALHTAYPDAWPIDDCFTPKMCTILRSLMNGLENSERVLNVQHCISASCCQFPRIFALHLSLNG